MARHPSKLNQKYMSPEHDLLRTAGKKYALQNIHI